MCMYVINICYHILEQFVYIFFRQFFMQNPYIFADFVQKLYKKLLLTSPESYVTIKLIRFRTPTAPAMEYETIGYV